MTLWHSFWASNSRPRPASPTPDWKAKNQVPPSHETGRVIWIQVMVQNFPQQKQRFHKQKLSLGTTSWIDGEHDEIFSFLTESVKAEVGQPRTAWGWPCRKLRRVGKGLAVAGKMDQKKTKKTHRKSPHAFCAKSLVVEIVDPTFFASHLNRSWNQLTTMVCGSEIARHHFWQYSKRWHSIYQWHLFSEPWTYVCTFLVISTKNHPNDGTFAYICNWGITIAVSHNGFFVSV